MLGSQYNVMPIVPVLLEIGKYLLVVGSAEITGVPENLRLVNDGDSLGWHVHQNLVIALRWDGENELLNIFGGNAGSERKLENARVWKLIVKAVYVGENHAATAQSRNNVTLDKSEALATAGNTCD